ncbi:hypothetical protein HII31_03179 [Pseudocercospora fuligena]|uniref:Glycoside hydrolase family 76 protein n=1 Tax=Pseudocercospora fuligena TaxID=685502 RepID=A0A8H6RPG2_9PEZI|nr:hypothetical protein HII31_03179 [Pseudocercospora fuligena]
MSSPLFTMSSLWLLGVTLLEIITWTSAQSLYWSGWHGEAAAWQWSGSDTRSAHWSNEAEFALKSLQESYWNGTNWPSIVSWAPWIGSVINTITASSLRTYLKATNLPSERDLWTAYSQIESYYAGEDAIKLFGQAYDDAQWVVLEWLEVIKFITDYSRTPTNAKLGQEDLAKYAHRIHVFYNVVQDKFDETLCGGGLTWNPALSVYKNAITNELFVTSSIAMYFWFPGDDNADPYPDPRYDLTNESMILPPMERLLPHDALFLENAKKGHWMKTHNFTNAQGLIVDGFHISENQTTCDLRDEMVYTYKWVTLHIACVILAGLRGLWEATGDTTYLQDGYDLIDKVINATGWNARDYDDAAQWAGLGRNGILEDHCDAPANCTEDQQASVTHLNEHAFHSNRPLQIFKGVYFQHLSLFCEGLPAKEALIPGVSKLASEGLAHRHKVKCSSYSRWIQHNALAALGTRDELGLFGQWWGAPYVNKTQAPAPDYAVSIPYGSADICNRPELLSEAPWKCDGRFGCKKYDPPNRRSIVRATLRLRQYPDPLRTVETQAQGVSILRAAIERTSPWSDRD